MNGLAVGDAVSVLWRHFALGFSALLPLVNPLGTALVFLGLVGIQPAAMYKSLARQIAVNMVVFFAVIELIGSYVLSFFGISLPIVQLAGGVVVAAIGWGVLNKPDADQAKQAAAGAQMAAAQDSDVQQRWASKTFYPLMFPITAGPGCLVVMLTLSAHTMESSSLAETVVARAGLFVAVILLSVLVYVCYAYAPQIAGRISPSTTHGILRVIAFILLCIGVQIAWNGLEALLKPLLQHHA
jgi:multiple antibiotic resistance protein